MGSLHFCTKCIKMYLMRTTVDIPEGLLRQAKATAAMRGIKLKELIAEALLAALQREPRLDAAGLKVAEKGADSLVLGPRCVFPLIRGECGPALRDLTADRATAILEEEDIERAIDPR